MAYEIGFALDCASPTKLAEFWKLALGYEDEPPPPPFTTREEWIAAYDDPDDDHDDDQEDGAWLHDPTGAGPRLFLQHTREPKPAGKNRIHLDIRVSRTAQPEDRWTVITATASRLQAAGATVVEVYEGHHFWMADPEGNDFCLC